MIKVVIVDDESIAVDNLQLSLASYPELEIVGIAATACKGRKLILEQRPELLFLDMELPDMLGLELLSELRDEVFWEMKVVFYTAYDKYLLQAFRESAFDYLLKPFSSEELIRIMERYRKAMEARPIMSQAFPIPDFVASVNALMPQRAAFMISTVTGFRLLHLEEIGFFEYIKDKRQWQVVLLDQTRLSLKKNTRADDVIGYSEAFVQINQSAIININYLAVINGRECLLYPPFNDRADLTVSRSFMKALQDKYYVI